LVHGCLARSNARLAVTKRVVITGAFSFTGAAVARELFRRGWTIHTLSRTHYDRAAEL
jgi:NAD(P)-dependent dehydrogenase (short-subunit alcohol dehydrogenase family)